MYKNKFTINYKNNTISIEYFMHKWDEKVLLYLHGLWANKEDFVWSIQDENLNKHTIIWFDFPWHGNSTYIKGLNINDLVEITNLIIKKFDIKNIILIWHSMWWLVWLLYLQKYLENMWWFISIEWVLTDNDVAFTTRIANMNYSEFLEKFSDSKGMYDYAPSMITHVKNWNLLEKYLNLEIISLFIYGENSSINYINFLQENWIKIAKIKNSWHHPFAENPDQFYMEITTFLLWI